MTFFNLCVIAEKFLHWFVQSFGRVCSSAKHSTAKSFCFSFLVCGGKHDLASNPKCVQDMCARCHIRVRLARAPELTPRLRGLMSVCADSRGKRLILLQELSTARERSRGLQTKVERKWPNLALGLNMETWCQVCSNNITDLLKRQRSNWEYENRILCVHDYGCSDAQKHRCIQCSVGIFKKKLG